MDDILQYIISTTKKLDSGDLPNFPDPAEPEDLGDPLTQDEIDTLKKFVKEIKERYIIPET
jgi:hypothetical protein